MSVLAIPRQTLKQEGSEGRCWRQNFSEFKPPSYGNCFINAYNQVNNQHSAHRGHYFGGVWKEEVFCLYLRMGVTFLKLCNLVYFHYETNKWWLKHTKQWHKQLKWEDFSQYYLHILVIWCFEKFCSDVLFSCVWQGLSTILFSFHKCCISWRMSCEPKLCYFVSSPPPISHNNKSMNLYTNIKNTLYRNFH